MGELGTKSTNMRIVAMIPARMGSKRVKNKNTRNLAGKMLVEYPIDAAIESGAFDEIYVNSESPDIERISKSHGVSFYKRDHKLATDEVTNDVFAADFLRNVECDILVQLLPTSPFISPETIRLFVKTMVDETIDTLISVKDVRIECIYKGIPLNFDRNNITVPSQMITPVEAYACGIMGWNRDTYLRNMIEHGAAYHGGTGHTQSYVIKGFETVDIDEEEDFQLAEVIANVIKSKERVESDVPTILANDGVVHNDLHDANRQKTNLDEIIDGKPKDSSWSHRVINSGTGSATLICQLPGESNRRHYHDKVDEWWNILRGSYEFEIDDKKIVAITGDVVYVPRMSIHKITAIGNVPAVRFAVSHETADHIYVD